MNEEPSFGELPSHDDSSRPLMQAQNISKSFNGVYALKGANFELHVGEVHALLGANGAGKSTLIKVMNGVERPDSGIVMVGDRGRMSSDVATVFQELSLIPSLSVTQNIFLGNEIRNVFGLVQSKKMRKITEELIHTLGLHLRPGDVVENLSVASRQLVEIAKAVHRNARILVLDEPTSTLTKADEILLFKSIRDIQKSGVGIIYVTHRLTEVFELADRVTVIRDGQDVLTSHVSDIDMKELVRQIAGESEETELPSDASEANEGTERPKTWVGPAKIEAKALYGDRFSNIGFSASAGEIVGIAGLVGTGRTEVLETIAGIRRATSGEIKLDGRFVSFKNPWQALAAGVALVPEDRHRSGVMLEHSIQRNLNLAHQKMIRRFGFVDNRAARALVARLIDSLQIKTASAASPVQSLSGGNQQKVVFAKWVQPGLRVLLLDEPTQGVDVKARQEIYRVIRRLADEGVAVVVVSSDFVELQELADTIYFMTSTSMSERKPVTEEVNEQYIYERLNERVRASHGDD